MNYTDADRKRAVKFKKKELAKYSEFTYKQVAELKKKGRLKIESPPNLAHFNFAMEVNDNDDEGGLELSIFYHDLPPYEDLDDSWSDPDITMGESQSAIWFEIYKDDRKEYPSYI